MVSDVGVLERDWWWVNRRLDEHDLLQWLVNRRLKIYMLNFAFNFFKKEINNKTHLNDI